MIHFVMPGLTRHLISPNRRKRFERKLLIISTHSFERTAPGLDIGGRRITIGPTKRVGPMRLRLFGEKYVQPVDRRGSANRLKIEAGTNF